MASPYVAGAAVLIRQAMAFAGRTNITQDQIYNVMANTADWVYDPSTAQNYRKLNMSARARLASCRPTTTARPWPRLMRSARSAPATRSPARIEPHFRPRLFHVHRGRIRHDQLHRHDQLRPGACAGKSWAPAARSRRTIPTACRSTSSPARLTPLAFAPRPASAFIRSMPHDGHCHDRAWAPWTSAQLNDQPVSGEQWYSFTTARGGRVDGRSALMPRPAATSTSKLYNANYQLISTSATAGNERIDTLPAAGQRYYVQLLGNKRRRLTPRRQLDRSVRHDAVDLRHRRQTTRFRFPPAAPRIDDQRRRILVQLPAHQRVQLRRSAPETTRSRSKAPTGCDVGVLRSTARSIRSNWYRAYATGFENVTIESHGGGDTAQFSDSAGNERSLADADLCHAGRRGLQ